MSYAPTHSAHAARRSRQGLPRPDLLLAGSAVVLAIIGVVIIYSATRSQEILAGGDPRYFLKRQGIWVVLGLVTMVGAMLFDYHQLEHVSTVLYVGIVLALLGVYAVGRSALGAQRWYPLGPFQFQPSEFATLALIIVIATYCARRPDGLDRRDFVRMLILAAVPIGLIVKQPDLGTGIVMSIILLVMLAAAGMPGRYLIMLVVGAAVLTVVAVEIGLLKHYQIERLTSFISPNKASSAAIYNVNQAKDAIGSGGFFGKGLFRGAQTNLDYVPSQQTDFIFSAVGEQLGFVGCGVLLLLYGLVAWRVLRAAQLAKDTYGRLLCSGVFALLIFSVFENVGMNVGIMPVAGIPLPFLSYGGSAVIVFFAAIGLALNVQLRSSR